MKPIRPIILALFVSHVVLLLLAATRFTLITSLRGGDSLTWNYFQYSYENGWGFAYQSAYTGAQVAAYLAAYALGLLVFFDTFRRGGRHVGGLGTILCAIGMLSFALEGSHWFTAHNLSWIASFPGVLAVLWIGLVANWIYAARATPDIRQ